MGWKTEDLVRGIPPGWVTRTERLILMNMGRYVVDSAAVKVCFAEQRKIALASGFRSASQMRDHWNSLLEANWFALLKGQTKDDQTGKYGSKHWALLIPTDDEWESGPIMVTPTGNAVKATVRASRIKRNRETTEVSRPRNHSGAVPVTPRWSPPQNHSGFTKEREKEYESASREAKTDTSPDKLHPDECHPHPAMDIDGYCAGCGTQVVR